ncbi:YceI family protein [Brumimicrobium glaciale]|uniref:YceI family protein n=1 Tax=Brumimicrobium glaciale TaxID=200475 RepID=A0A4Q4KSV3_9FLAO|nr:YceI family protein [Brumimicrobium glaciale]RYM35789.1 YceI family protein [Brumimicrobium glaciale]
MKKVTLITALLCFSFGIFGQKHITRTGTIQFFSETDIENIEAINNQVSSVIDAENGEIAFSLLMKAFTFEKALMQEHFNEKYVESEKFPKAKFKGKIINFSSAELSENPKEYTIKGSLTIHGVTKEIEEKISLSKTNSNHIIGTSTFIAIPEDYEIKIPSIVRGNISKTIEIKVKMDYEKMD